MPLFSLLVSPGVAGALLLPVILLLLLAWLPGALGGTSATSGVSWLSDSTAAGGEGGGGGQGWVARLLGASAVSGVVKFAVTAIEGWELEMRAPL